MNCRKKTETIFCNIIIFFFRILLCLFEFNFHLFMRNFFFFVNRKVSYGNGKTTTSNSQYYLFYEFGIKDVTVLFLLLNIQVIGFHIIKMFSFHSKFSIRSYRNKIVKILNEEKF